MFVRFVMELPTFQCITTNVSDNNKQYRYISVLLLWSQIVLVYCFSGKFLMHRTVHLECWGVSYLWLMLVENINCYVCVCAEEICPLMLLRAYRAAELCVNILKDNIEMDSKGMELMTDTLNLIGSLIIRSQFSATIYVEIWRISCPVDLVLKVRSAHTLCGTTCFCSG